MRLETIPLVAGGLIALLGLLLLLDAWLPDEAVVPRERRRRVRRERSRGGEALIAFGLLGMAGAFLGLDQWPYRIVAALAGLTLLLFGMLSNRKYMREVLRFRGVRRRADPPMDRGAMAVAPAGGGTQRERIR